MEYAKLLQQSAGKFDYRESPLKTLMKVNDLRKTIDKDGRANIVREEPYANKIETYLSKEELKRKINDGARKYLTGVRQYYNNIALGALTNDPEDQSIFLKEARKQAQQLKLLNDPSQVEYLKKVDPLGLFYLEKSFESQKEKIIEAMKDTTGNNLKKLIRGQPLNTPAPINPPSSDTDSVFPYGLGALRSENQLQLTENARNAIDRFINKSSPNVPYTTLSYGTSATPSSSSVTSSSSSYGTPPQTISNTEIPIQQQHAQELMDENPILEPPEAFRQAERNIIDARPVAQELMDEYPILEPPEAFRQAERNIIDARPVAQELMDEYPILEPPEAFRDAEYLDYERELTMRAIDNALAKDRSLDRFAFTEEVLNNPELAESIRRKYVDEMIPSIPDPSQLRLGFTPEKIPEVIPSTSMLKKYGRITLEKMAESHNIPYDGETTDSELRKRLILKRKEYTGVLPPTEGIRPYVQVMPYRQSVAIQKLEPNVMQPDAEYLDYERELTMRAIDNALAKDRSLDRFAFTEEVLNNPELAESIRRKYVDEMIPSIPDPSQLRLGFTPEKIPEVIPSTSMLKKYGRITLEKMAESHNIPYDGETTDSELRKRLILKRKEYTGVLPPTEGIRPYVQVMPYRQSVAIQKLPSKKALKTAGIRAEYAFPDYEQLMRIRTKEQQKIYADTYDIPYNENESIKDFKVRVAPYTLAPTTAGEGFRPLSSYPPHIIGGALHIVKQRKKLRTNPNEYNREQAYHLTQQAIRGGGFFGDLFNKINLWTFRNINPIGRMITHFENQK